MKAVILAGGMGTRLAEETDLRPKPMVEIGGRPILWHIMKHYSHYGHSEFFLALGYKGEMIKRYFLDYHLFSGSMTVSIKTGDVQVMDGECEDWVVHLADTGLMTNTGGRIKRLEPHLRDGTFLLTYGDGVCNVDLDDLIRFHHKQGRIATITAVRPAARFGGLVFDGNLISTFIEKPQIGEGWVNGGFIVVEPALFDYLHGDEDSLESNAFEQLAAEGQLAAYRHEGFWQCMDTLREKRLLEAYWQSGEAPWRVW
jgi:glucose-1-phosphate cytidylyltransferase